MMKSTSLITILHLCTMGNQLPMHLENLQITGSDCWLTYHSVKRNHSLYYAYVNLHQHYRINSFKAGLLGFIIILNRTQPKMHQDHKESMLAMIYDAKCSI